VHDVQRDVEHKQSELQIVREREIHTIQRARNAQEAVDRAEAALQTAINVHQQQQQKIDQIRQTALTNTARDDAAQRIIDGQAIHSQATIREIAAQALRDQAAIGQGTAGQLD